MSKLEKLNKQVSQVCDKNGQTLAQNHVFFCKKNDELESEIRQATKENQKLRTNIGEKDSEITKTSQVCLHFLCFLLKLFVGLRNWKNIVPSTTKKNKKMKI